MVKTQLVIHTERNYCRIWFVFREYINVSGKYLAQIVLLQHSIPHLCKKHIEDAQSGGENARNYALKQDERQAAYAIKREF